MQPTSGRKGTKLLEHMEQKRRRGWRASKCKKGPIVCSRKAVLRWAMLHLHGSHLAWSSQRLILT